MPLSRDEFTQQLTASGLLDEDSVAESLSGLPPDKQPVDGEQLARELVKQKKLTKFQAEQLYAGKGKSLTLGNYVILDKLGQGGMGMVLKAEHKRMKRLVALKVMSPTAVKTPDALKRFHREVEAAAKLTHPNIVNAFDADEAKGTHFLVMEYVEGTDLSVLVKKHGPLPVEQAVQCIIQAARGLEFAHEQGVIHRDIKPANLLIDAKGTVKILDMGLARIEGAVGGSSEGAGLTSTGTIMGTVDYMSPEQAMDTKHADARSDIYSLGCSLYYLLTGKVVYDGDTMMKKLMAHQNTPIPSLSDEARRVGRGTRPNNELSSTTDAGGSRGLDPPYEALDAVFRRMVAKRPEDRPQTMTQVMAELERCLSGGSPTIAIEPNSNTTTSGLSVGSGNELQDFLRQISGGESSTATSAAPSATRGTVAAPSSGEAETMISSAGDGGTDPRTEQTLTLERSGSAGGKKKKTLLLCSLAAVVVVLLAIIFVVRGKSGTLQLEITDDLTEVTIGDTSRVVKGLSNEEIRVPLGEHVLHVQREDLAFDTDPFEVTKGENVPIKVERVGRRVRAMQGKTLLGHMESPKSSEIGTISPKPPDYALEFDRGLVDIPLAPLDPNRAWTIEGFIHPVDLPDPKHGLLVTFGGDPWQLALNKWSMRLLEQSAPIGQDRSSNSIAMTSVEALRGKRFHVAGVYDGQLARLFVEGKLIGSAAPKFLPKQSLGKLVFGHTFIGTMDEWRISKVARYGKDFTPLKRYEPDTDTVALYHFDEGQGDVLKDSSGNNHHGKIVGAKWVKVGGSETPQPQVVRLPLPDGPPGKMWQVPGSRDELWFLPNGQILCGTIGLERLNATDGSKMLSAVKREAMKDFSVLNAAALTADGKWYACMANNRPGEKNRLWLLDVETGRVVRNMFNADGGIDLTAHKSLAFSPDGRLLAGWGPKVRSTDRQVTLWNVETGSIHKTIPLVGVTHPAELAFSPDGRLIYDDVKLLTILNVQTDARETIRHAEVLNHQDLVVSADGKRVVIPSSSTHLMIVIDVTEKRVRELREGLPDRIRCIDLSRDGRRALLGDDQGSLTLWNLDTLTSRGEIGRHGSMVAAVRFSPDGRFAVSSGLREDTILWRLPLEGNNVSQNAAPPPAKAPFDAKQARTHQEAWAKHLGVPVEYSNSIGMKFVLIPPGEFTMGSTDEQVAAALKDTVDPPEWLMKHLETEVPARSVTLTKPFYCGVHEVTIDQFRKFVETGYQPESIRDGKGGNVVGGQPLGTKDQTWEHPHHWEVNGEFPVTQVTWNDARAFAEWLSKSQPQLAGYDLPTEAQWEFACRAGTTTRYSMGDTLPPKQLAQGIPVAVGRGIVNPFGLCDMHGNVAEWCLDTEISNAYSKLPSVDPVGVSATGLRRLVRGGGNSSPAPMKRSSHRVLNMASDRLAETGFRLTLSVEFVRRENGGQTVTGGVPVTGAVARGTPFVTLRNGAEAARHATLEEALEASQPQDVIEVHGNGPFPIGGPKSVVFQQKEFTLKGAAGFRPLFVPSPGAADKTSALFHFNNCISRFEDIDLVSTGPTLFQFNSARNAAFLRCRCANTSKEQSKLFGFSSPTEQKLSFSDCCLLTPYTTSSPLTFLAGPAKIQMTNTLLLSRYPALSFDASGNGLRMNDCTIVAQSVTFWSLDKNQPERRASGTVEPSRCLILGPALTLHDPKLELQKDVHWQGKDNVYGLTSSGLSGVTLPNNVNLPFDEWMNSPAKPETGSKLVPTKAKPLTEFLDPDPAVMFHKLKTYLEELRKLHPDVGADPSVAAAVLAPLATAPSILFLNDPAFQQWMKELAAQPGDQQVVAVAKKLQELNSDFDGTVTHTLKNGGVFELSFSAEHVRDISPVRALTGLKSFGCRSTRKSLFADLSPLQGLSLTTINLESTSVSDLSPLKGMSLTSANFGATLVSDLSPLQGMPLTDLTFYGTLVADLSALKNLKLKKITVGGMVSDLSALKGMPLTAVNCAGSQVSDLSPLRGMALTSMDCQNTKVTDLSPLKGMPLTNLRCDFVPERDTEILRSFKALESINYKPAAEFWKSVESPSVKNP